MSLLTDLVQIGFTEYEAKVYLALLGNNPATGYQLSKKSGVPRSMVYETLSRLQGRGVVLETAEGRTTLYRPLPPEVLLDRREQEHQRLLRDLKQGLQRLYTSTRDDRVWSIGNRPAVLAYAAQMIHNAQSELFLVLNDADLDALHDEIAAADDNEESIVSVSIVLTGERELDFGHVVRHPPLESELHGLTDTLVVVADSAETLVASAGQDATATVTRNPNLVLIARQFVWMEMFTQRIYAQLGPDLLKRLDPADRQIFESLSAGKEGDR
jgi:Cd2+/Zn2+-exporting ATPase